MWILTFAVLKTTFLQSGRMLTDQAGRWYELFRNTTVLSFFSSMFEIKATHAPEASAKTSAYKNINKQCHDAYLFQACSNTTGFQIANYKYGKYYFIGRKVFISIIEIKFFGVSLTISHLNDIYLCLCPYPFTNILKYDQAQILKNSEIMLKN